MNLQKVGIYQKMKPSENYMKMKKFKITIILFGLIILLSACSSLNASNGVFKQFTVGVGTHSGNEIWGRAIRFDTGWSMPSGALACCWEEPTKTTTAYKQKMPKEVYVEWVEQKTQLLYRARVPITPEITKLANSLPSYTLISSQKRNKGIYIIVGMGVNGEVVIWLSNSRSSRNVADRKLYVVGKAKAYFQPWVAPDNY